MAFLSSKTPEWKDKFKRAMNSDNIIDLTIDIFLLFLEVLATPILLPIRIAKYYLKKMVSEYVKRHSKAAVNKIKTKDIVNG